MKRAEIMDRSPSKPEQSMKTAEIMDRSPDPHCIRRSASFPLATETAEGEACMLRREWRKWECAGAFAQRAVPQGGMTACV